MDGPVFDHDSGGLLFPVGEDLAEDENGRFWRRLDENLAMDELTLEVHSTSPWDPGRNGAPSAAIPRSGPGRLPNRREPALRWDRLLTVRALKKWRRNRRRRAP